MSNVYEQEAEKLAKKTRGFAGGGGDFDWLDIDKPASEGSKTRTNIRVVQRLHWEDGEPDPSNPYPEYWVRVSVHRGHIEGKFTQLVCPEDRDVDGWREHAECPICLLQKELWDAKREDYEDVANSIGARWRVYCNVIDLDDVNAHWKEGADGSWVVRPKVFGYSKKIHDQMMEVCINNGPIEDYQSGRPLVLTCERTGPKKFNIRYSVTHKDQEPVPNELMPIVYGAFDLAGLAKPATMEELRKAAMEWDPRPASGGAASTYSGSGKPWSTAGGPPSSSGGGRTAPPPPAGPSSAGGPPEDPGGPPSGGPPSGGNTGAPPPPGKKKAAPPPPTNDGEDDSYAPKGGYEVEDSGGPPPPPNSSKPKPPPQPARQYHYSGPQGQHEGLSAEQVATYVEADSDGEHFVWAEGMDEWGSATDQGDVKKALAKIRGDGGGGEGNSGGPPGPPGPPPF